MGMINNIINNSSDLSDEKKILMLSSSLNKIGLNENISVMIASDIINYGMLTEEKWNDIESNISYDVFKNKIIERIGTFGIIDEKKDKIKDDFSLIKENIDKIINDFLAETGSELREISDIDIPKKDGGIYTFRYSISIPIAGSFTETIIEAKYKDKVIKWSLEGKEIDYKGESDDLKKLVGEYLERVSEKIIS